jgi:hypothetical protein
MRGVYLTILFLFGNIPTLNSQQLILKETKIPWQGITLSFPEDVVIREQNLTTEKSLHVYPARREPFFVVLRRLPIRDLNFTKNTWESEIFWHGKNVEKTELKLGAIDYQLYKGDQIRNQNLLRANLWIWSVGSTNYWVWILFRKDRVDLVEFFENGQFLNQSSSP